jgi:hypothetical protein
MVDMTDIGNQLRALDGKDLVTFWCATLNRFNKDPEFEAWYIGLDMELKSKVSHALRQWIDVWSKVLPKEHLNLLCLECRKSRMVIDPNPEPGTRWKCSQCGARF